MSIPNLWRNIPEQYRLIGKRCKSCGALFFPSREICRECGSQELEPYKFKGKGKIVTYTIIRTPISDPDKENIDISSRNIPYAIAIIQLDEGPMLTAEIVDCRFSEIKINKRVEMVFRRICEKGQRGIIRYGYKFRIAQDN